MHAASHELPIADGDVGKRSRFERHAIEHDFDGYGLVGEVGADGAEEESRSASDPFGTIFDQTIGEAAEPETEGVDEGSVSCVAVVRRVLDSPDIDPSDIWCVDSGGRLIDRTLDVEGFTKVPTGASRTQRKPGRGRVALTICTQRQAGDAFMNGAVASDRNNRSDPGRGGFSTDPRGVLWRLGPSDLGARELAPEPFGGCPGPTAPRLRVGDNQSRHLLKCPVSRGPEEGRRRKYRARAAGIDRRGGGMGRLGPGKMALICPERQIDASTRGNSRLPS